MDLTQYLSNVNKSYLENLDLLFSSLKMLKDFLRYFTPFYIIMKARKRGVFNKKDFIEYIVSQTILIVLLVKLGVFFLYIKYWLAPLFLMIPYYYFVSALQHGLIHQEEAPANSRDIVGNSLLMELLLPCKTNFHSVHHESPHIRCWDLEKEHIVRNKCSESYRESVDKLFSATS